MYEQKVCLNVYNYAKWKMYFFPSLGHSSNGNMFVSLMLNFPFRQTSLLMEKQTKKRLKVGGLGICSAQPLRVCS